MIFWLDHLYTSLALKTSGEDQNFQHLGLYLSLNWPNVHNNVIETIVENTKQIVGLNFTDNKIQSLETLIQLAVECRQLKALDLSKDQVMTYLLTPSIQGEIPGIGNRGTICIPP